MSIVNTAMTAIMASLEGAPAVAPQIDRVRLRALAVAATQAVVVRPLQAEVTDLALSPGYPVSWNTAVSVECYAKTLSGIAPDITVDALIEAVYARLMADNTLGGAVLALQPREVTYDFDVDGKQLACGTLIFNVRSRANGATFN